MQDAARDYQVVALRICQFPEGGLERAAPITDINDFVALCVAVVELVILVGERHPERNVIVEQHRGAVHGGATAARQPVSEEVPHAQPSVRVLLQLDFAQQLGPDYGGRAMEVVEQRGRADESLVALELLVVDATVRLAQSLVALLWQLAQPVVAVHQRFPRAACSSSMASNSALKLP